MLRDDTMSGSGFSSDTIHDVGKELLVKYCPTSAAVEIGCKQEMLIVKETPEQNGIAERMIRTITDRVRCVQFDGSLPELMWRL